MADAGLGLVDTPGESARRSSRRRRVRWLVAAVLVATVLAVGIKVGVGLGDESRLVASPLLGKKAPSFSLPRLDGGTLHSGDWQGRVYVVNFWASWCVPCRKEAPILRSFHERWSPRGVELVGIVVNDTVENARTFRDEFRLKYPQVEDPGSAVRDRYGVRGVPETYIVNERGTVMAAILGELDRGTLDDAIGDVREGRRVSVTPRT
jgi:cytochrome c biogenesis protein CcmG/thiol:disulfide interchange protein DsbE